MPSLADRLKALGVRLGVEDLRPPPARRAHRIENVIEGELQATPFGDVFVVRERYALGTPHGNSRLSPTTNTESLATWLNKPDLAAIQLEQIVFLDTETTGLARGTGTYAFLIGLGDFEEDGFRLVQFFLRDPIEEPALLCALTQHLAGHKALVTFNGLGFDVPLLNVRYISNAELSPLGSFVHVDLLPIARRLWHLRLASRALSSIETAILGVRRTAQDVPGWAIPSLYFDYLRTRDARPLANVFYHNAVDVLSMAALLNHVSRLLAAPLDPQVHGLDLVGMARMCEHANDPLRAAQLYACAIERGLPPHALRRTRQRLSFLHKRCENLEAAVALWHKAAADGEIYALVELAKYCEHREGDHKAALHWTETALDLVRTHQVSAERRARWLQALLHRRSRLQRRCGRADTTDTHYRQSTSGPDGTTHPGTPEAMAR